MSWVDICALDQIDIDDPAVALLHGEQVALVRTDAEVFAVEQRDPYSGAQVMARGIVGSRDGVPTLTTPMYKQVFDLRSGACLEPMGQTPVSLRTWPVRVRAGRVLVQVAS